MKPDKTGQIKLDTAQLHFEIYGSGEQKVLLLHGNGESGSACYEKVIEEWSKKYTLIVMDSRGQGKSTFGLKRLTVEQIADDAFALLEALNVKKACVVGFSDGANAAVSMLLKDKGGVLEKAVLAGGNLFPAGIKDIYLKPMELKFKLLAAKALRESSARKKLAVMSLMVREPKFSAEMLKNISVPVLVMAGSRDMIKDEHTRLIAKSLPNARLEIIKGCDHFVFNKGASASAKVVADFLGDE